MHAVLALLNFANEVLVLHITTRPAQNCSDKRKDEQLEIFDSLFSKHFGVYFFLVICIKIPEFLFFEMNCEFFSVCA